VIPKNVRWCPDVTSSTFVVTDSAFK